MAAKSICVLTAVTEYYCVLGCYVITVVEVSRHFGE
jgi:hypothetical protein